MPKFNKKILIVEDERMIAKTLAMKLDIAGFAVENAYDGEEAMEIIKQRSFDLIILDLMLPKLDGFGVLERLKKEGVKTPVIIASNLNGEQDVSRVLELGCMSYYVKADTSLDDIVSIVKGALNISE